MKTILLLCWTILAGLTGAVIGVKTQPPAPIQYRVQLEPAPPTLKSCRDMIIKDKLKGSTWTSRNP